MSADRDVSDVVLTSFTSVLRRERVHNPAAVGRELVGIARAHGIRFAVPVHWHDPNADPLKPREPGDQQAGVVAALAAIGKGVCTVCGGRVPITGAGLTEAHQVSDDPPHPPFHDCPGGDKPPRNAPAPIDEQEQP